MENVQDKTLSNNNIRSLVYFFSVQLDQRLAQLMQNTPYQKMRVSDTRTFVVATRGPKTISEIARHLHISRQSIQSSVSRLAIFGLVKLAQHPTNKREKLVNITQQGWAASAVAILR
ncbi:MAG: MarR family transcriptional regulator [Aestuariivirga sp.]